MIIVLQAPVWNIQSGDSEDIAFSISSNPGEIMRLHNNGNVGIGTTNPNWKLSVAGNGLALGAFNQTGSSGSSSDGNTSTDYMLRVAGADMTANETAAGRIQIARLDDNRYFGGNTYPIEIGRIGFAINEKSESGAYTEGQAVNVCEIYAEMPTQAHFDGGLHFKTSNGGGSYTALETRMKINHTGEIGIGTTSPDYKLHIEGSFAGNDKCNIKLKNTASNTMMYFQKMMTVNVIF